MSWIIKHDDAKCIGCGVCVALCPDNWELGTDGKAHPKKTEVEELGCNEQAAKSCPMKCISIEEKK